MSFEGEVDYHWDETKDHEWVEVGEKLVGHAAENGVPI